MKKNIMKLLVTLILTAIFFKLAYHERGYAGLGGGEMFIPVICILLFWVIPKYFKN